ncbi:MAG TPA: polysaccharide deacetylase family protein [Gillisia sp.]|nr:polysaccharide deacetylase family protein [Gillisia sp.]
MTGLSKIISTAGRVIFPSLLWNFDFKDKTIYLTFDDGPIPEITPWVLARLKDYNAKATFFCISENISRNPSIFRQILSEGHSVGNHTYSHLNGWKTPTEEYIKNVLLAEKVIKTFQSSGDITSPAKEGYSRSDQKLFRPPFGKITPGQIKKLEKLNYKIAMWDVISEDYDQSKKPNKCFEDVVRYSKPGSIVVFHDSVKAFRNLQVVLPEVLKYYSEKGFEFKAL